MGDLKLAALNFLLCCVWWSTIICSSRKPANRVSLQCVANLTTNETEPSYATSAATEFWQWGQNQGLEPALLICLLNGCTSFVAGLVVSFVLGFTAQKQGVTIEVADSGKIQLWSVLWTLLNETKSGCFSVDSLTSQVQVWPSGPGLTSDPQADKISINNTG